MTQSAEAEFLALGNALHIAVARGIVQPGAEVLVQSDCMWALQALRTMFPACADRPFAKDGLPVGRHRRVRYAPHIRKAMDSIRDLIARTGTRLVVRHVRGHTSGDGRQWVNRACDKAARAAMRAARETQADDGETTTAEAA